MATKKSEVTKRSKSGEMSDEDDKPLAEIVSKKKRAKGKGKKVIQRRSLKQKTIAAMQACQAEARGRGPR